MSLQWLTTVLMGHKGEKMTLEQKIKATEELHDVKILKLTSGGIYVQAFDFSFKLDDDEIKKLLEIWGSK